MRGTFVLAPNGDQLVPSSCPLYRSCPHFRESVQMYRAFSCDVTVK